MQLQPDIAMCVCILQGGITAYSVAVSPTQPASCYPRAYRVTLLQVTGLMAKEVLPKHRVHKLEGI